ncbi:MAG: co-chaperone GroES [Treponema sp.]|nr:co-chaperone GroES [Treponema sp.]
MKIRPLADRVLVKQVAAETKTAGGLIIPDTAQEKTQQAVVEAVGPGTEKDKITVKAGDKVLYDKYSGTTVKMNGEEYLILKNSDIIAVIED